MSDSAKSPQPWHAWTTPRSLLGRIWSPLAGHCWTRPRPPSNLLTEVNAEIDAIRDELPGLGGRTFALAQYIPGSGLVAVADEGDGSSVFFQRLGLTMLPALVEEGEKTGQARISFSPERLDLLHADLLAFLINGADESALEDIPGFDKLPGTVAILDYDTIVALNTPSALSVPYAAAKLKPYLVEAAAE